MRPQERDDFAKHRRLEAIEAELARYRRMGHVTLFLVALLNAMLLAVLAWNLLGHD
ncbi:hypothetical protein IC232_26030 [Microvirga sp. BT688]|uniref:hypothetical protein n=1 Tax=Microvirga sp. TaxID=1873136 RepID=UPI001688CE64|nr:hypothetical protein [Microvirga sp.]MBD2750129.1 hypothetical protein [Microvirga sp.]